MAWNAEPVAPDGRRPPPGALLVLLLLPAAAPGQDIPLVKSRLLGHFLAEGAYSQTLIQSYLDAIQPDGSWPDINYSDRSRNEWPPVQHLYRVEAMAKAYRTVGHSHYGSPAASAACRAALDYWYLRDPRSDNWWWNEIGTQITLAKSLILLEDELSSAQINSGCTILARADPGNTGQNRVWAAKSHFYKGLLHDDAGTASWALGLVTETIVITTAEGIQPDYSFQQHGETLYSGGYGAGFTYDTAFLANVTRETVFAFTPDKVDLISNHLLQGQRYMVRGRIFDYGVYGRGISRKDITAWEIVQPCLWLAELHTARENEFLALHDQLTLATPPTQPAVIGNRHFWHSDFMTHSRAGFYMSTRMYSTRNYNTDGNSDGSAINGEGKRSHHIADGCTFILLDGEEYHNVFGVWDWYRIPGTTVEYGTSLDPNHVRFKGSRSFVGGVSDGTYGLAAMDFQLGGLTAKKAWFYSDGEVVCLGAAIHSSSTNNVLTSLNQCLLDGPVTVRDAQGARTLAAGDRSLTGLQWAHHDGVGYVFPAAPAVRLKNQAQSNSWHDINDVYPADEIDARDVFSLWLDHGPQVVDADYRYLVVPGVDADDMDTYLATAPIVILSNSGSLQAVENTALDRVQAAFYQPGTVVTTHGLTVSVDQPCLAMVRQRPALLELAVSNPVNQPLTVNVDMNRYLTGAGATWLPGLAVTRIAVILPSGNDAGRSVLQTLARVPEDFDYDGDVDQEDYGYLQGCLKGDGVAYDSGCEDADLNTDGVVDQADVAIFEPCMGGPDQPPGC